MQHESVITSYSIHYTKLYDPEAISELRFSLSASSLSIAGISFDSLHAEGKKDRDVLAGEIGTVITSYSIHYTKLYDYRGEPIGIDLPIFIDLQIVETEPGLKGDTVSGATKPATLESGAVVQVPLFLDVGDRIKVDTRTGTYIERA